MKERMDDGIVTKYSPINCCATVDRLAAIELVSFADKQEAQNSGVERTGKDTNTQAYIKGRRELV